MPCNVCHSKKTETVDFPLWARRIVVPFDRSILTVQAIGLFVNCVSAKPVQTPFLGQSLLRLVLRKRKQRRTHGPLSSNKREPPLYTAVMTIP